MAAGANRQYNATFTIGAKLLGSFRGVMNIAQARLNRLNAAALRIGSGFKRMGLAVAGIGGFLAGFGVTKVFQAMFEGAVEAAEHAEHSMHKLSIVLLAHESIRKRGLHFAEKQAKLIFQHNEALAKQGVIGRGALNAAAAQLAVYGFAPKKIAQQLPPMMDLLVAMKGVTAGEEDAVGLVDAWGRAIKTGQTRALRRYGVILSDTQQKEFKGLKNIEKRNNLLLRTVAYTKDSNREAAKTPLGQIKQFHNALDGIRREIGNEVIPVQAEMAEAWTKALPETKPVIIGTLRKLGHTAAWAGEQVADLFARLNPPQEEQQGVQLFTNYKDLIGPFNAVKGQKDQSFNATTDVMNQWTRSGSSQLITALGKVGDAIAGLGPHFEASKQQSSSWGDWLGGVVDDLQLRTAAKLQQDAQDIAALGKAWEAFKNDETVTLVVDNWNKSWSDLWTKLKAIWAWMNVNLTDEKLLSGVSNLFKGMGSAITDFFLKPLNDVRDAWKNLIGLSAPKPVADAAAKIPMPEGSVSATLAKAKVQGFATGGIIRGHSLLQVAERGPEAIIPLSGGRRAEGLLNYAAKAIGVGSVTNNRDIHVTLTAPITINGNVGENELRAIEAQTRKQVSELIALFKQATAQERRLSFESGYQ